MSRPWVRLSVLASALVLAGCASLSVDQNTQETARYAQRELQTELRWLNSEEARQVAQQEVTTLLERPLTQGDAARLALAYSPAFQALLAENAAASARSTQTARLPNPVFAFEKLVRTEDGTRELEIGRVLSFSLLDLLYLPSRIGIDTQAQARLRLQAAGDAVQAVTEARQAWVRAVAAQQSVAYFEQVMQAASAGAELARRMQAAGNWSRLQRAQEQAFYAESAAQLTRARQSALEAREGLVRALGLDAAQAARLRLPERLPDLPTALRDEQAVLQQTVDTRLDVGAARFELERLGRSQGLTRVHSVLGELEVGVVNNSETGKPMQRGYELSFPIPLFDFGSAARAGAEADYLAAVHRLRQTAIEASSLVRQQYAAYATAHALARHYREEIVPLRKTISDEKMLKYNGMLIGVFALLADAREQVASVVAAIDAERDFWLSEASLQASMLGKPTGGGASRGPAVAGAAGGEAGH